MTELADGLQVRRLAEIAADRGAQAVLAGPMLLKLQALLLDGEVVSALAAHIGGDQARAESWLRDLERRIDMVGEDDADIVMALAFLGNVLISAASEQGTASFEAVSLA